MSDISLYSNRYFEGKNNSLKIFSNLKISSKAFRKRCKYNSNSSP